MHPGLPITARERLLFMPKRLHDTECWRKQWFRSLCTTSKLLWLYILDNCDCAGVFEADDIKQISFFVGCRVGEKNFKDLSKQLKPIDLKRYFVLDFIEFQYGSLTMNHKMYSKIINLLAKFGIKYPIDTVSGLSDTVKEEEEDVPSSLNGGTGGHVCGYVDTNTNMLEHVDTNVDMLPHIPTWRESYDIYLHQAKAAFVELSKDRVFFVKMEGYHQKLDIIKTMQKAYHEYWGTKDGWENKKRKKIKTIDWTKTITKALDAKWNWVWKENDYQPPKWNNKELENPGYELRKAAQGTGAQIE